MPMFSALLSTAVLLGSPVHAEACEGTPADWIEAVRVQGKRDAYLCIAKTETAGAALLEAIGQEGFAELGGKERITRALAVHLLHQLERPLTGEEVRALAPADRRLLRDGVYARRGRPTPSPEHEAVFSQFAWYAPVAEFNNGRLEASDRENIAIIDKPPKAPVAEAAPSAAEAMAETNTPRPPPPPGAPPPPEGAPPPDDLPPGPPTGPSAPGAGAPPPPGPGQAPEEAGGTGCTTVVSSSLPALGVVILSLGVGRVRRQD